MSAALDMRAIERAHETALEARAVADPRPPKEDARVPDILGCVFEPKADRFWLLYDDLTTGHLRTQELQGVAGRQVCFWEVDEFRRGVEVVLDDGTITSFSAEYPRYLHDAKYRHRADAEHSGRQLDVAHVVAENIKALRSERGWTVTELGRRSGMAPPNVHRVESAAHVPTTSTLLRLAAALEVPLTRLLRASTRG